MMNNYQTHYGYENSKHHNHKHHHQSSSTKEHVHRNKRAGHNRRTKDQKRRTFYANIIFAILSLIALAIIAIIAYDRFVGLF